MKEAAGNFLPIPLDIANAPWHTAPMTNAQKTSTSPRSFRARAERIMREAHPAATLAFAWTRCERVRWFDGSAGFSGTLTVTAPGYRTLQMTATENPDGISVR